MATIPLQEIVLAGPRGFCAGVNMAVDSLEEAIKLFGTPIYAAGQELLRRPRHQGALSARIGGARVSVGGVSSNCTGLAGMANGAPACEVIVGM